MSWKDTISKNLIKSDDINTNEEVKPNNIRCYNCSDDMNYKHYISCDGRCFFCWQCFETQHINEENKTIEGHHVTCNKYYDCDECNETTIGKEDKHNYIDFIDNDFPDDSFIFDKDINTNIKYNNKYYHYECFCKFLGKDYMKLVCNKCKIYCKDINNMRDINDNPGTIEQINVCIKCYDNTDIRKCYNNYYDNNACKGERVIMKCYYYGLCKTYSHGCIRCNKSDCIKEYCDWCR